MHFMDILLLYIIKVVADYNKQLQKKKGGFVTLIAPLFYGFILIFQLI